MANQLFQNQNFKIYRAGNGYIVHNKHKDFKNGHTHVRNYDICKVMIKLAQRKQIPKSKNGRFIKSIIRISSDKVFIGKLNKYMNKIIKKKVS